MVKKVILLVGPSGSGKTTLMENLFQNGQILRSSTSRPMRPGEVNGQDYLFVSKPKFEAMIKSHSLVQKVEYNGNYYGVSTDELENTLSKYDTAVVAVVYSAIGQYLDYAKTHSDILILPFFTSISRDRLFIHFKSRTESEEQKQKRISLYDNEIKNKAFFPKNRILNMDPDDYGKSSGQKLLDQVALAEQQYQTEHEEDVDPEPTR